MAFASIGGMGSSRPKLHALAIELTAYCNQKCSYCYNAWREDGGASVGHTARGPLFSRIERLVEAFEIEHVTLTGGEPLAHKEVFALLEWLAARGVARQMISNGGLVTDAIAARLASLGLRYVQVTLNAPAAALHDEHVGGAGHFDATIAGIEALVRHHVPVVGCVVVTRKNAALVGEILSRFEALGIRHVALSRFSPAGYAAAAVTELLPSRDDVHRALEAAEPFAAEKRLVVQVTMPLPPCAIDVERFGSIQFGHCPIGTSAQELALGPDGRLRNCTLHGRALGEVDVGDPSVDLVALLASEERAGYRAKRPAFCAGCAHEETCGGGCGAAAAWVLGDGRAFPDPLVWQHVDDEFGATLASARKAKRSLAIVQ